MSGHLFIVHGDITRLACDAWLLPGGAGGRPGETWSDAVAASAVEAVPSDFGLTSRRVIEWRPLVEGRPIPYLTDVGGSRGTPIDWYLAAVREFLDLVAADLMHRPPRNHRARPLVALPLVGTGYGGKRREAGAVARELLPVLYEAAATTEIDIALVMIEGGAYSAAQSERAARWTDRAFSSLDAEALEVGRRLARRAALGRLVLFLGAGVGTAAGLPGWDALLEELAEHRANMSEQDRRALMELSHLDRARVIESRLQDESLGAVVARHLEERSTHYALAHALLAALPVEEVVTTNYDRLFEMASEAAGSPPVVLPYERVQTRQRWMLKLHGCVRHPEDIVLTRDHYLAYRERREALAGIVQALLITRHMLFVGFSLQDDNFHQIVRAVRRAARYGEAGSRPFGTALSIVKNPLAEELWQEDVRWAFVGGTTLAEGARCLEILLDRIAAGAIRTTEHLFDPRYDEVLSDADRRLKRSLETLCAGADEEMRATDAWREVEALMARLGWNRRS